MNTIIMGFTGLLITALACGPVGAWSHSGAYGSASGGGGSWSASGARGGSASGGGGSWSGEGARGGTASGGGGSWSGEGARGGTASGGGGSWSAQGASGGSASGGGRVLERHRWPRRYGIRRRWFLACPGGLWRLGVGWGRLLDCQQPHWHDGLSFLYL
jgi:hypothetical protein